MFFHRSSIFYTISLKCLAVGIDTVNAGVTLNNKGSISSVSLFHGIYCNEKTTITALLRFSDPTRPKLKAFILIKDLLTESELVEIGGREALKGWIVRFGDVDTIEQAKQLVGSTVLISDENRPDLEEGEFYTRDLVGMRVILKETGKPVGTVVNVYNSGASDLLHVMLNSSREMTDGNEEVKTEQRASDPLVWVPFVEAIVPNVDMSKREMLITPPKGLLELNIRADERSKKERRQLEWKERKKFQKRLIAAKKKLCELEQQHVFHGFRFGDKAQRSLLADQIVGVNSKLLRLALQNIKTPSIRLNLPEFVAANLTNQISTLKLSENCHTTQNGGIPNASSKLQERSLVLASKGKVAIVIVVDESKRLVDSKITKDSQFEVLETLLCDNKRLVKMEYRGSVPLVLVCPADLISSIQSLFSSNNHFGFNSEKVWFLEEEKIPVVSSSMEEQTKNKILMKSPWEILQTPVGSGGVISLLSSHNIVESLSEVGVEYIEVCSVNERFAGGQSLLGLVDSRKAHLGIQIFKDTEYLENDLHMIFSMKFMKQLTKQIDKLQFLAVPTENQHVEKVGKEFVDITPSSPNSYELCASIYSSLSVCPPSKVCVVEITE
ncbi:hypothetical protein LguiB_004807 [Lonicera macranthoides]